MRTFRRFAWLPLVMGAAPAHAHSPVPGIEGFYVGVLHPFSTPEQALVMVALGLLAGRFTGDKVRWIMACFLVGSLAGLVIGPRVPNLGPVLLAMALVASAAATRAPGRGAPLAIILSGIGGYLIGEASIPDHGPVRDRVITMTGAFVGANLGLLYLFGGLSLLKERYTAPWLGVALRAAAASLAIVSLLILAFGYVAGSPAP